MMRIITGKAKGVRLNTLEGSFTRPTSERVKEAVFSMLQFDIEGRTVLDLFSGSGQMALEAISRGAASAVMVDKSKQAIKIIEENVNKTRFSSFCKIVNSDSLDYINRNVGIKFDIIFIDPPYASNLYTPALMALYNSNMLKATTLIVCESDFNGIIENNSLLSNIYSVKKTANYGKSIITILEPTS